MTRIFGSALTDIHRKMYTHILWSGAATTELFAMPVYSVWPSGSNFTHLYRTPVLFGEICIRTYSQNKTDHISSDSATDKLSDYNICLKILFTLVREAGTLIKSVQWCLSVLASLATAYNHGIMKTSWLTVFVPVLCYFRAGSDGTVQQFSSQR